MKELAMLVGAVTLYMVIAMWATQPVASCAMTVEPHRYLDLAQEVDREHLDRDVRKMDRAAQRYAQLSAPVIGSAECRDLLARQIATTHEVTLTQIQAARAAER